MSGIVNYVEKGYGLWKAIRSAGHTLDGKDGVYVADDPVAVQSIINGYDPLPDQKAEAITDIKATALAKMQTLFPALVDIDTVNLVAELWKSLVAQAKSPTPNWNTVINIYTAAQNGIAGVNAATTKAQIDSAVASIVWPV